MPERLTGVEQAIRFLQLLDDLLATQDMIVQHIMGPEAARPHRPTDGVWLSAQGVTYPLPLMNVDADALEDEA